MSPGRVSSSRVFPDSASMPLVSVSPPDNTPASDIRIVSSSFGPVARPLVMLATRVAMVSETFVANVAPASFRDDTAASSITAVGAFKNDESVHRVDSVLERRSVSMAAGGGSDAGTSSNRIRTLPLCPSVIVSPARTVASPISGDISTSLWRVARGLLLRLTATGTSLRTINRRCRPEMSASDSFTSALLDRPIKTSRSGGKE